MFIRRLVVLTATVLFSSLAAGQDIDAGRRKAEPCQACHGVNGNSTDAHHPTLAGQTARYIYLQLKDFKEGRRTEPQMEPFIKDLSRQDMFDLAAFFAAQKPRAAEFKVDMARVERGRKKADETLCTMCHLGGFKGQNEIPRVAGQHPTYVIKQMTDFKTARRTNDAGNMASVSKTLSEQDIVDLAHFLVTLD